MHISSTRSHFQVFLAYLWTGENRECTSAFEIPVGYRDETHNTQVKVQRILKGREREGSRGEGDEGSEEKERGRRRGRRKRRRRGKGKRDLDVVLHTQNREIER